MAPLLEIRNLTVGYGAPLLRGVSFTAEAGEILGILGRNGCGKTTLLRGLCGGIRRFSGEILVNGTNCTSLKPRRLATQISVLHQQTAVLEGITARQMIGLGRYPHRGFLPGNASEEAILESNAALLGIGHLLEADCAQLSQGQRQMVLLCRLLVQDTPVMLLDEPNAALDYDNTVTMMTLVREVVQARKKTALLVLHDPELALAHCDRLLIVRDGRLCRDICPARVGLAGAEEALRQLYPNVILREDPFNGAFRCYHQ